MIKDLVFLFSPYWLLFIDHGNPGDRPAEPTPPK
jgi:hypothetical protein